MTHSLNIRGSLYEIKRPQVMGIINVTPDSFYAGSRVDLSEVLARVEVMLRDGADMLDLGGYSTRPGAAEVSAEEEVDRLLPAIDKIRSRYEDVIISIDTFRADVARACMEHGADIINDISGGDMDPEMFATVAELNAPYILMHTRGTPATMQSLTDYEDVTAEVLKDLAFKCDRLRQMGVSDIIIDPGYGFAKTVDQNYELLGNQRAFEALGCPILTGISRKTMIWKELGITPAESLNGTTALNMLALMNGADILRVHDVKEASETVRIYEAYRRNLTDRHIITTRGEGKTRIELI